MKSKERREKGMLFLADDADWVEMKRARRLLQELNTIDRTDFDGIRAIVCELFGKADETTFLNPPFFCDYGYNIEVGKNCFINYNCTFFDNARITLGDNCPGVHIGSNVVIGAGSVVTRDIPDWSFAAGNPCRVIRRITEEDKPFYFKDRRIDVEIAGKIWG